MVGMKASPGNVVTSCAAYASALPNDFHFVLRQYATRLIKNLSAALFGGFAIRQTAAVGGAAPSCSVRKRYNPFTTIYWVLWKGLVSRQRNDFSFVGLKIEFLEPWIFQYAKAFGKDDALCFEITPAHVIFVDLQFIMFELCVAKYVLILEIFLQAVKQWIGFDVAALVDKQPPVFILKWGIFAGLLLATEKRREARILSPLS